MPVGDEVVEDFVFAKLTPLAEEWIRADHGVQERVLEQLVGPAPPPCSACSGPVALDARRRGDAESAAATTAEHQRSATDRERGDDSEDRPARRGRRAA